MTETERVNSLRGDSTALYAELIQISKAMLPAYLGRKGVWLSSQAREEISHDAVSRLTERIRLRGDNYIVGNIRAVLRNEFRRQIYDDKKVAYEQAAVEITGDIEEVRALKEIEDESEYFKELLAEPDGGSIICVIYFAQSFKTVALSIAEIKGKKWVYDHVQAIKSVYDNFRGVKWNGKDGDRAKLPSGRKLRQQLTRLSMLQLKPISQNMTGKTG